MTELEKELGVGQSGSVKMTPKEKGLPREWSCKPYIPEVRLLRLGLYRLAEEYVEPTEDAE